MKMLHVFNVKAKRPDQYHIAYLQKCIRMLHIFFNVKAKRPDKGHISKFLPNH